MNTKHLLSLKDLSRAEIEDLFALTRKLKADPGAYRGALAGKTLGMIFQKPSTRTRVSFEVGVYELGGHPVVMSVKDSQLGRGESLQFDPQFGVDAQQEGFLVGAGHGYRSWAALRTAWARRVGSSVPSSTDLPLRVFTSSASNPLTLYSQPRWVRWMPQPFRNVVRVGSTATMSASAIDLRQMPGPKDQRSAC